MTLEGVTFVEGAVRQMSREEFIALHVDVLWLDRRREVRIRMLSDAYDLMMQ